MRKRALNILTLILSVVFLLSFMSGCSGTKATSSSSSSSTSNNAVNSSSSQGTDSTTNNSPTVAATVKAPIVNKAPTNATASTSVTNPTTVNKISVNTTTVSSTLTPAVNVADEDEYKKYVVSSLSQGKDLAVNLQGKLTASTIGATTMKIIETSGYSGYISGIQYGINNNVAYITVNYKGGLANYLNKINLVNAKVQQIVLSTITSDMSDYDKELALHDYVVNNVSYDYDNYLKNTIPEDSYTAYGALISGVAVCEGYAEAIYKLLSAAGVKAYIITGLGNGQPHAWNLVNISGGIYHLDATFDDPPSTTLKILTHNYFNVNDSQISKDHSWKASDFPKSDAVAANYFTVNDLVANNVSKYYDLVKNELLKKNTIINIRTSDYNPKLYTSDVVYNVLKANANITNVDTSKGIGFDYDKNSNIITILVNYN